ncbi:EAL domain-containing protein [Cellulomonas cellasea]|uniref:Diguanylate cyclase (GGDEF)-like protein/PAS domain S-box-containing protein n=1 Tax=Cellulomonas cellasea TaxID=43670 RepID=A0A7W4UIF1_9CELL|nr:EAL domain-containing protein [Cellulomonas cellasea]MBB2924764.1 diguanylate cyclase (GGDEF)-like protein/PAS domain S-box-containing protein [Cellulomonas cellasea]
MVHVGVLTPITGGFYYGDVVANVTQAVAAAGGHVTLVQTIDAGRSRQKLPPAPDVPHIGWDSFDGIVAIAQAASASSLRSAIASGTPVVTVGSEIDLDAAQVVADNRDVVRGAVGHLVGHGHRRIAFVGNLSQSDTNARYEGFRAGVAAHGLGGGATLVTTVDHVEAGGRLAADAVLATGVTAVVTGTDRIALGLAAALRERGVRIPEDLAVIGYDDVEEGWWHDPPLTTVHQAIGTLGTRAAELLLAELRGEPDHGMHVVGSTFVARETCGCPAGAGGSAELGTAGADELVAVVLRHLEEHAGTGDEPDALARLDAVLAATVARLYPSPPPPEAMLSFSETVVDRFSVLASDAAGRGDPTARLLRRAGARTMLALRDHERGVTLERTERLASSIVEQYDVGIEVLSTSSGDPEQLAWLTKASARVACLALWEGDPADGVLHVTGVFDPEGRLDEAPSGTLRIEDFPPRALVEQADAGVGDVLYVVPVRGVNGDHGFLCVLGACERGSRSDPATYAHWATTHNHWAAVLGVALKQKALLGHLGRSEERYSLAASAAKDGLWEWEAGHGHVYVSERCRELLGVADDAEVTLDTWVALAHPLDTARVAAELGRAVDEPGVPVEVEYRVTGPGGAARWVLTRCLAVASEGVVQRVVGSVSDIQTRKDLEDQLRQEALYDNVTGLPNRRLFVDRLDAALRHQDRQEATGFAVLFFDLDGFKLVNDSLGHLAGDELLRVVADRLRVALRPLDTAARFGGDEFAVLLVDPVPEDVLVVARRLQDRLAEPVQLGGQVVAVTASVGVATSSSGYRTADDVLRDADAAMYDAKGTQRGSASVFDPEMHVRATGRLRVRGELRGALARGEFVVHYQPVVALDGSGVESFEALVRWEHPERGLLLPGEFLPVMEDDGSVVPLGRVVLDQVCRQVARWRTERGLPVTVAVNLSHREFWAPDLVAAVRDALARHDVPARHLVLEITESVVIARPDAARDLLEALDALGVRLHIDDFGTGQSSLTALRTLPVHAMKVDGSFVRELASAPATRDLVRVILDMGRVLGLEVIAECVETAEQAEILRAMGCTGAQGWLYARALPGDEAGALLGAPAAEVGVAPAAELGAAPTAELGPALAVDAARG